MRLGIQEIYEAARAAGFTPDQATTWTAIALAESGGETGALNDSGEHSMGLWQINVASDVRSNTWGDLNDPSVNARAAYEISHNGTDMRPWTTTHASNQGTSHDYRTYLAQVSQITGYEGDPRGVEGYGSPLPPPLPPSGPSDELTTLTPPSYDQIDAGMDPSTDLDTDSDGLTDSFERMSGSSPDVADTDQDGLSDAREAVVTGTDALLSDTDGDQLTDSTEQTLGTTGTSWDSDSDGVSDGTEVQHRHDPLLAENGTVPQQETVSTVMQTSTLQSSTTGTIPDGTIPDGTTASSLADQFVALAQAQEGDSYVFGTEADLEDADPNSFDCSELTQWAADQVGVTIPDGAMYQYLELKNEGQLMSVDEALQTKGALLFYFSEEPTPGGSRPGSAHVAISLGDGRTIEARGSEYGVMEVDAGENASRFNYAGVIPEMAGSPVEGLATATSFDTTGQLADGPDSDQDGLSDAFEQMVGLDPMSADSDGDGIDDATEQLGGSGGTTTTAAPPLTRQEVAAALAQQGLDATGDEDEDGLSNRYEIQHRLDALLADSDGDGLTDSTEVTLGTSGTSIDSDSDGLTDFLEQELGTDPLARGSSLDHWGFGGDEPDQTAGQELDEAMDGGGDLG